MGFMSFVSLFDVDVMRHVFAFLVPLQVHSADAMKMLEVRLWADDPEDIYSKLMRCGANILQQAKCMSRVFSVCPAMNDVCQMRSFRYLHGMVHEILDYHQEHG